MRRRGPWWWPTLLLAVLLGACGDEGPRGLARVKQAGVLRWGGDLQGGEPYVFEDPKRRGHLVGFEVELADAIARELGVKARFQQTDWPNLVPTLERGAFDVALNGLEVTPARSGRVLFTRPYFLFRLRLMARRSDKRPMATTASLGGLRVGTLANSQAWDLLRRSNAKPIPYEGVAEPYVDLENGRLDAVLLDDIIAERYGVPRKTLRVVGDLGDGYYAAAVRPGEEDLRRAIDAALARIARSGELRRILARWRIDDARQERLVRWQESDTRKLMAPTERTVFNSGHVLLFLEGAGITLLVSLGAMLLAIPLGILLALLRLYGPRWAGYLAAAYVEIFRGTPVLLQLYLLYFGLAPYLRLDAAAAAIVGLGLNYAAYEAEVYRAGILGVPRGQIEAAWALGMSTPQALWRVVLPQALRLSLPNVTNDFISLLKDSSLVSVITVVELTKRMQITAVDTRSWLLPGLLCAGLYFAMSFPLARLARRLESRLERA